MVGEILPNTCFHKGKTVQVWDEVVGSMRLALGLRAKLPYVPGRGDKWLFETEESMDGWTYAERVVLCLTIDLPAGCFFTVDRNFMTPKLAAYMKLERSQYVTGTMKRNVKFIDNGRRTK